MGSGRHCYSPGLLLPFPPQPPLGSRCQDRVGWGSEEGADPGGGGGGERRTEEALPPRSQPPTPPPPLPEGPQAHTLNWARARGQPCQSEGAQGPGVGRARQRAHMGPGSAVPGRGRTEPSPQEADLGGIFSQAQNELARGCPWSEPASGLGNLLAPSSQGTHEETQARTRGTQ